MTKIYIVRHGQDKDNEAGILNGHRDTPLTSIGMEQAKQLSQKIKDSGIRFDKVYSSPLQRAFKTAQLIARDLDIKEPEKSELLIERNFGCMSGKFAKEIVELCSPEIIKTNTITYFLSPQGAETFPELIERAKLVLNDIKQKHDGESVLLVTHGDFGKMLYTAYYELDWRDVLKMFHFGNSEMLLLSESSAPEDTHVFNIQQYNH